MSSPIAPVQPEQIPDVLRQKIEEAQFAVADSFQQQPFVQESPVSQGAEMREVSLNELLQISAPAVIERGRGLNEIRMQYGGFATPGTDMPVGLPRAEEMRRRAEMN